MFFYKLKDKILISQSEYNKLNRISESEVKESKEIIYVLNRINPLKSRRNFCISDSSLIFLKEEGIHLLQKAKKIDFNLPPWLKERIKEKRVSSLNTEYPNWQDVLNYKFPSRWKVNIVGLGDVGGVLLTGLRLLGGSCIESIGIYDKNINAIKRWKLEANQIFCPFTAYKFPEVYQLREENIFDCDIFIFCATVGVPSLREEQEDVRMKQFEGNFKIISDYARKAREKSFKGIFAVISDPVDLLCKAVFLSSNKSTSGEFDFKGLAADQIRGYGLGVMHARAVYYSKQNTETAEYNREGRAFGPHGQGLVIANSLKKYDESLSEMLTAQTVKANLEVRRTGFKPYVAPALSSGSYPLIATMSGKWHYSATFIGGVFMGAKNRSIKSGIEIERLDLPVILVEKIKRSYQELGNIL
ncbi:MAG TPA: lactate dehydrogenase [Candidatus Atribacteria bacterium]|nr:MAG: L-lactate dehydrogenase [Atribacteria bacterium 34_128]HAJ32634.1 lactate dehydrogenase [Candidatus Atribacteria bacterium]